MFPYTANELEAKDQLSFSLSQLLTGSSPSLHRKYWRLSLQLSLFPSFEGAGNRLPEELKELKLTFLSAQKGIKCQRVHLFCITSQETQGCARKGVATTVLVPLSLT